MAEQTFRSPGFFENEVDLTQRDQVIEGIPAGIVGTAQRGPAFVPTTVGSFSDFESKFGSLDPDSFGPYAVHTFLQNRSAVTYIRVLGAGSNLTTGDIATTKTKGTVKNAGFRLVGTAADGSAENRHEGTVQFLAAVHDVPTDFESMGYPIFTDNQTFNVSGANAKVQLVRSMVMMASGARLEVLDAKGNYPAHGTSTVDVAMVASYTGSDGGEFKLVLSSALGSTFSNDESKPGIRIYTASLDPNSDNYVGKLLNTNPDRFHEEQHLLYADFAVESELARVAWHTDNATVGVLSGSAGTSSDSGDSSMTFRDVFGSFNTRFKAARTTSFISQPFGGKEYDLFHFESLDDGEIGNTRVKVSISNLRRSTDPTNPYGTFTVLVRGFNDTDTDLQVLEQYSQCTLDPGDDRYVGTLIGDMKAFFNFDAETRSERRLTVTGKRPNRSRYVRIIMNSDIEDGRVPKAALPFGFRGIPVLKTSDSLTDDESGTLGTLGSTGGVGRLAHSSGSKSNDQKLQFSVVPPLPLRFKTTRGAVDTSGTHTGYPGSLELVDSRYYWGVKFERVPVTSSLGSSALQPNASSIPNPLIKAYSKFLGISKLDALVTGSAADAFNNNKFTLARVALNHQVTAGDNLANAITNNITGAAGEHMRDAAYLRDKRVRMPNYTMQDSATYTMRLTFASLAANDSETVFNRFTDYMKFTNMFYGGFNGVNILDRDQRLINDRAASVDTGGKAAGDALSYINLSSNSSPGAGKENNAINSYRTAGEIITDEMATRVNIVAIPGIRDSFVTDHVADKTRDYGKAIYLMDIPSYDDDTVRLYDDDTSRPNVRRTVEQFEGRAIDNNYVATYYPDILKQDPINGDGITVPGSVAALGALALNDSISYPWFAPAGFNRGALSDVLNTKIRLNTEDRNVMYEARINPIANFPNGGFVIFGQKTLQQARSALDRVNVRRMLLEVKRIVSDVANRLLFEQNTPQTRARFVAEVTPLLSVIQSQQGIDQFKIVMDSSNNSRLDVEQNRLNGRVILVPTRAVEFISMDFIITNSGVSFE